MKKLLSFCAIAFFLTSCNEDDFVKEINFQVPEHQEQFSIHGEVVADFGFAIGLSHSVDVFSTFFEIEHCLTAADLKLFEDGQLLVDSFHINGCHYTTFSGNPDEDFIRAKVGSTYRLEVSGYDYPDASAEVEVPQNIPFDTTFVSNSRLDKYGTQELELTLKWQDPPGLNYYELQMSSSNDQQLWYQTTDASIGGFNIESFEDERPTYRKALFTDELFDNEIKSLKIWVRNHRMDEVVLYTPRLLHVSEATYLFRRSRRQYERTSDDPFSEPVNVFSNVTNGFGVMTAESATQGMAVYSPGLF